MPDVARWMTQEGGVDTQRRHLLLGVMAATATLAAPWVWSRPGEASRGAFAQVSSYLLGRDDLDVALGDRLQHVLSDVYPDFQRQLQALAELLSSAPIEPLRLQKVLDVERPELAVWPRRISRGWAVGVVGDGADARCVAYETALNAVLVADVLKPPSYAYGAYGSWSKPPLTAGGRANG